MNPGSHADATLVLIGHGSTKNADSTVPVYRHAAELRRRRIFAEVAEAFWLVEPKLDPVLNRIASRNLFVIPLFISEGYFTEEAIPEALGLRPSGASRYERVQQKGPVTVRYGRPVGTHDGMADVVLARAQSALARAPFPRAPRLQDTTLFLAGHGTRRNENSRKAVEWQADRLADRGLFAAVRSVFMEEQPGLGDCYALAPTSDLVVVPFFMSDGLHVSEDIPVMLGESARVVRERLVRGLPPWRNPTERHGKRVWYTASVGTDPLLAEVILERVAEVSGAVM